MTTVSVLEVFTLYSGPEEFFEKENSHENNQTL